MRVALLTTGMTEMCGLPVALKRLFSDHHFEAIHDIPRRPFPGFTSAKLPPPPLVDGPGLNLDKMVARAVALVDPATHSAFDLVVMIDDLELANRDQPEVVCDVVRTAVERHLTGLGREPSALSALRDAVRARLSFHLAVPMIESWFFAAPQALTALGVNGDRAFHKRGDPEQFESTDRAYIAATDDACPAWCRGRSKNDRPKWLGDSRIWHPKGYLQWLLIDPADKGCTTYREGDDTGRGGGAVLRAINWAHLLSTATTMRYARALIDDLADGLGQAPALGTWAGEAAPLTGRTKPAHAPPRVLRNL